MNSPSSASRSGRTRCLLRGLAIALIVVTVFASGFAGGMATLWLVQHNGALGRASTTPTPVADAAVRQQGSERLDAILAILKDEFYDPSTLDMEKLMRGAASGLVSAVGDPYTVYVEPVHAAFLKEDMSGSFEGIGATVNAVAEGLVIVKIQPGSPAGKSDLRAADVIVQADGVSLAGMGLLEAVGKVRGPRGTTVRLLVQREGTPAPFEVSVTRDRVETPIIEARMLEKIAYLRLAEFNALAASRLHEEVKKLLDQDPAGLVLDLRSDPGGLLTSAIDVASEFLPREALVVTQRQRDGTETEYRVTSRGLALQVPLVVLINGDSASASEIVSGALRDHKRAVLVGEPTYGKGCVQNVHELADGSSLRVTVALFYLPGGETPNGNPIKPDLPVTLTQDDLTAGRDPQLDRAVQYLLTGQ
jgi:carboxyl-terminal processing protease